MRIVCNRYYHNITKFSNLKNKTLQAYIEATEEGKDIWIPAVRNAKKYETNEPRNQKI